MHVVGKWKLMHLVTLDMQTGGALAARLDEIFVTLESLVQL